MARAAHVCPGFGKDHCTEVVRSPRCPTHTRAIEAARRSASARGYGHRYRLATAEATEGATHCPRCGSEFTSDNPATGGHLTPLREGGTRDGRIEAQCRRCNYGWRRTGL